MCGTFETANEWYEYIEANLLPLLRSYQDALPAGTHQQLEHAAHVSEASRAGIARACKVLDTEIERVIGLLPAGSMFAPILVAGLIAVAVGAGALTIVSHVSAATVTIHNENCGTIELGEGLPRGISKFADVLGIELPSDPIRPGEDGKAKLPPMRLTIDASARTSIELSARGQSVTFDAGTSVRSISFDGRGIVDATQARGSVDVARRGRHILAVTCE